MITTPKACAHSIHRPLHGSDASKLSAVSSYGLSDINSKPSVLRPLSEAAGDCSDDRSRAGEACASADRRMTQIKAPPFYGGNMGPQSNKECTEIQSLPPLSCRWLSCRSPPRSPEPKRCQQQNCHRRRLVSFSKRASTAARCGATSAPGGGGLGLGATPVVCVATDAEPRCVGAVIAPACLRVKPCTEKY